MAEVFSTLRWTKKNHVMSLCPINSRCVTLDFCHHKVLPTSNALLSLLRLILGIAFFNCDLKNSFFFFFLLVIATHFQLICIFFFFLLFASFFFNNITFSFLVIITFLLFVTHI